MFLDTDGDCPGITPDDMEEITITQPALDDAIDCDLHAEEDEDDDDSGIDEGKSTQPPHSQLICRLPHHTPY